MDVDGVLLDIDGVLAVSFEPLAGATEALAWLRERGIPFLLATNTTTHSRRSLAAALSEAGLTAEAHEVVNAPTLTAAYLRSAHPGARCYLLGEPGDVVEDLEGVTLVEDDPEVVVVAGADDAFTWDNLNRVLRWLEEGTPWVAMHRNLIWMTSDGLRLDAGAYIAGLEVATGRAPVVTGKPSPDFFHECLSLLEVTADRAVMVGDDLDADVLAAQDLGITGVLVRTGKFREEQLERSERKPDHVIESIADLPELLGSA